MNIQATGLDLAVIILIFAAVLGIGYYLYRKGLDNDDFIIAGRKLKWYAVGFHGAATYVGVGTLIGALGYAYNTGVSGALYPFALSISFIIMFLIAKRLRCLKPVTTGDILTQRFSHVTRAPAGIAMLAAMVSAAAAQIMAFGVIAHVLLGIDVKTGIIIISVIALAYTLLGGMLAVAYTDVLQGFIMVFSVIFLLLPVVLWKTDGVGNILENIPEGFMDITTAGWPTILSYLLIYGLLLSFYTIDGQRAIFAAKDEKHARKGAMFAFILLVAFTTAGTLIGMAGSYLFPGIENSDMVFATMSVNLLPAGLAGLALGGIFAAGMSTYDTSVVAAAAIIIRDVYEPYFGGDVGNEKKTSLIASIIMGVIITVLALSGSSIIGVINLGWDVSCCVISASMVAALFWPRATTKGSLASMAVGFAIWLYMYFFVPGLMAAWIAIPASLITLVVVSLLSKPVAKDQLKTFYKDFGGVIGGKKWFEDKEEQELSVEQ